MQCALAAGHEVRAGVFTKNNLGAHPKLTIVQCDATKEADVKNLITDCDAVVSLIGHVRGSTPDVQTVAIQKIVAIMKETGPRRLVSLTGTGVRFAGDKIILIDRFLNLGLNLVDPKRLKDGRNHAEVLKNSGLDWTLIRVLKLQNVKPRAFVLSQHGPAKLFVGRKEVAQAILEVLAKGSFIKQAPIISPLKI